MYYFLFGHSTYHTFHFYLSGKRERKNSCQREVYTEVPRTCLFTAGGEGASERERLSTVCRVPFIATAHPATHP